ncbi:MAG: hypothetical protein LBL69_02695 [Zoogloeaceae bacterium]|jgi:hypothetical protein|nr:hypothetical protein [Zoogloeaceae bacterium]
MRQSGLILLAFLGALLLPGCATRIDRDGQPVTQFDPKYLAKSDTDRVLDLSRKDIVAQLLGIADKLYKRNPKQWRNAGFASREAALVRLADFEKNPPADLAGLTEGPAALKAFAPDYPGDRVAALVYGLLTMVDAAYEHKSDFYILTTLDPQKLHNCARNMEIALWKLASAKGDDGLPLIVSNELDPLNPNLSYEREFGKIIGLLDFLSSVVSDKTGRAVTRVSQSLALGLFLPIGGLQ